MHTILIDRTVKTDKLGYSFLIKTYCQIKAQNPQSVILDFTLCQCFEANLSSVLGALLDTLTDLGYEFWFRGIRPGVRRTLTRNGFLKTVKGDFELKDIDKEAFIQYKKFSTNQDDEFKKYIDSELINKQRFPKHTEKVGKHINTNIYEVFVNAATHGECDYVYCCGEFFADRNPPQLDMTIVDCGNTIDKNVNAFLSAREQGQQLEAHKAIEWAVKERNTTKNTTGGLGLSMLMEFLALNKGNMHIVSSNGVLSFNEGKVSIEKMDNPFPGTIVNVEFNFNDDNMYYMANEEIDLNDLL